MPVENERMGDCFHNIDVIEKEYFALRITRNPETDYSLTVAEFIRKHLLPSVKCWIKAYFGSYKDLYFGRISLIVYDVPMETERITVEPSRLCRACGAERLRMFPLFVTDPDDGLRFDDMLMACTDLKVHVGDGLPSSICYSCAYELKTSYRFKQRCETTDRYFNELGLKSNEIKQEQETVVFKEREKENLLELKEEMDTTDNSGSLSFKEVTEGISEAVVISRETKQEEGDLTITETVVYQQEEKHSEVIEDEAIRVGNLEDSPPNDDLPFVHFPNKKENRNIISKEAENEFSSGSKQQNEEEIIHDGNSEASSRNDSDPDYFPKEELRKTDRLERFKCDVCGKLFTRSSYLWKHKQTHEIAKRKRLKCETCEKSFATSSTLRHHKRKHENGRRELFKCDVCGKSFPGSKNLREHKQRHPKGGQKRFKCETCDKSFTTAKYLREHKLRHPIGGQKRFKCETCGKSFATSSYLYHHRRTHENGEEKRFKCETCEKSFASNRYLRLHKKRTCCNTHTRTTYSMNRNE